MDRGTDLQILPRARRVGRRKRDRPARLHELTDEQSARRRHVDGAAVVVRYGDAADRRQRQPAAIGDHDRPAHRVRERQVRNTRLQIDSCLLL